MGQTGFVQTKTNKDGRKLQIAKESDQDRKMTELAASATERIQKQVDKKLEPKLDVLLVKKVKISALKPKPNKKDQHYKLKSYSSKSKAHFAKMESLRYHSVDSESTLAKFAKQNFGVKLSRRGKYKPVFEPFYDCHGIDSHEHLQESG